MITENVPRIGSVLVVAYTPSLYIGRCSLKGQRWKSQLRLIVSFFIRPSQANDNDNDFNERTTQFTGPEQPNGKNDNNLKQRSTQLTSQCPQDYILFYSSLTSQRQIGSSTQDYIIWLEKYTINIDKEFVP